jgi:hypothetical protein
MNRLRGTVQGADEFVELQLRGLDAGRHESVLAVAGRAARGAAPEGRVWPRQRTYANISEPGLTGE